ncbi:MAG: repressor LexA [Candidatus Dadabacteria bacterium]|nr:MAG: repressor LexA [Candidatus Dadabacteria bacterium]
MRKKIRKDETAFLAPVQRVTLEFLRNFVATYGYAPTLKEIAEHLGVKSLSTAHFHLQRLEEKGFIQRTKNGRVRLLEKEKLETNKTLVPLLGVIAAGLPIEAVENPTPIEIPSYFLPARAVSSINTNGKGITALPDNSVFCLEVSGDSMIDEHICDGDIIVVKKQSTAENGQIVIALLEDGGATLKRFRRLSNGKAMLIPANPKMKPFIVKNVTIQGILIGVIRRY